MQKNNKKIYLIPEIQIIKLDKEISLALESVPPAGPNEIVQINRNYIFKELV